VFVTNQELSLAERAELQKSVSCRVEIYHLERITAILDKPTMRPIREQFLRITSDLHSSFQKPVFVRAIQGGADSSKRLIGRDEDSNFIAEFLNSPSDPCSSNILAVVGMPGVGKTALALKVAGEAMSGGRFPGGGILIDFDGYAPNADERVTPQQVLSSMLLALGASEVESEPSRMLVRLQSFFRELDAMEKRVLLLFDNISEASQVEPLLPYSSGHKIIVTSRNSIASRIASDMEVNLTPLPIEEGIAVIEQVSRYGSNETSSAGQGSRAGLNALVNFSGGLPIALQLVGEILRNEPSLTADELANELTVESTRLAGLEFEDANVKAVFAGSYARLAAPSAKCFRFISIYPGREFSVDAISTLLSSGLVETRRTLRSLESSHLITRVQGSSTWTMHDLLRLYSAEQFELTESSDVAKSALSLLYDYYAATAEEANGWLNAGSPAEQQVTFHSAADARAWMSTEVSGIVASVEAAAKGEDYDAAWRLGITIQMYLDVIGGKADALAMAETALWAAQMLKDEEKEADALNNVGLALNSLQRHNDSKSMFMQASRKYSRVGNKSGQARVLLGLCDVLRAEGSIVETIGPLKRAVRLNMEDNDWRGAGFALTNLGIALREGGQHREAIETLLPALKIHEESGALRAQASTLVHIGTAYTQIGDQKTGLPYLFRARDRAIEIGDVAGMTSACVNIGNSYRQRGDLVRADEHYSFARNACEGANDETSLALVLWNLVGLARDKGDHDAATNYLTRLKSIPKSKLPYEIRKRI
jgi:tetratricopeptide (TPR) repeat protein